MTSIMTDRLVIRNFNHDDWRPLKALIAGFNASPYAAYDHPWPASDEELRELCRWFALDDFFLAVCLRENGRFIGYVALSPEEAPDIYNLGFNFAGDFHGRGYALESCRALIEDAFGRRNASKIVSGTAADNIPACRLLLKLGMTRTGSGVHALRRDEAGRPIEFQSCLFELSR